MLHRETFRTFCEFVQKNSFSPPEALFKQQLQIMSSIIAANVVHSLEEGKLYFTFCYHTAL